MTNPYFIAPFQFSQPYQQYGINQPGFGFSGPNIYPYQQQGFGMNPGWEVPSPWAYARQNVGIPSPWQSAPVTPVPVYADPQRTGAPGNAGYGNIGEHLSPESFLSGAAVPTGNYLPPEFLQFLRAELVRCGKALRTIATSLEQEDQNARQNGHLAATAQFFYALGLLYTRGFIIPPDVPGANTLEEVDPALACEVFGESLERFAREQFLGRGSTREISELSEKARNCFHALVPETEQFERNRDEKMKLEKGKRAANQ